MAENELQALAVYGSLAPGESDHWVISRIEGEWRSGTVTGYIFDITWGPADGYAGLLPDPDGVAVPVQVLFSDGLDKKWREVDEFQGPGFERQSVQVTLDDDTTCAAHVHVALTDS